MSFDNNLVRNIGLVGATAAAAIALLSIKYNDRPLFYEFPKGIPRIKGGLPVFGHMITVLSNSHRFNDFFTDSYEELDTLTLMFKIAGVPESISTIDPQNIEYVLKGNFKNYVKGPAIDKSLHELLGKGIFNANGEQWRYQRKAASHIFNVKNFQDEFTNVFVKETMIMCNHIFNKAADDGVAVDFHESIFKFTLDSFVLLGFGVQLNSLLEEEKVPFAVSFDYLQRLGFKRIINPFMPVQEAFERYLQPWKMCSNDHARVVDAFAKKVIQKRRQEIADGKSDHKDLLSRFMGATNEHGEKLNDKELRDSVLNLIIAGRDTTAQALSWLFYNLTLHPRVEEKMMEELKSSNITDEVENDSPALYEIINTMTYFHAVFYETLRLHPSVPGNQKYALEDDILPDGTVLKAGNYIGWNPYAQGRNTKIWGPNAKDFYPERWIDQEGKLIRESSGKWPAFHGGPRICLGQNLATLEALVSVAMLLKRYHFKLVPDQEVTYDVSVTLPMKNGLKVFVERR